MKTFIASLLLCCSGCAGLDFAPSNDLPAAAAAAQNIELAPARITLTTNGVTQTQPLPAPENIDLADWLGTLAPLAESVDVDTKNITVKTSAGQITRPIENVPRENTAAAVIRQVATAAERSAETGSPIPLATGIIGGVVTLLTGIYASKKRKHAAASQAAQQQKQALAEAVITGLAEAPLPDDLKTVIADAIQDKALAAGVEHGPDGLKATVAKLHANLKRKAAVK